MLTKQPQSVFVPGQPYIPEQPAYTVCLPQPENGQWVMVCTRYEIGSGSYPVPPFELVTVRDSGGNITDQYMQLCVARWVPGTGGINEPTCTHYPAVPAQPYIPASYQITPTYAWDAGANSTTALDGNVAMNLTEMDVVVGVVVGLTQQRAVVEDYARMSHAFYFHSNQAGQRLYQVMESGVVRTANATYTTGTTFSIRRINDAVVYVVNSVVVYRSTVASTGQVSVGTSMYGSGDTIP